jgi:hypothetical protein
MPSTDRLVSSSTLRSSRGVKMGLLLVGGSLGSSSVQASDVTPPSTLAAAAHVRVSSTSTRVAMPPLAYKTMARRSAIRRRSSARAAGVLQSAKGGREGGGRALGPDIALVAKGLLTTAVLPRATSASRAESPGGCERSPHLFCHLTMVATAGGQLDLHGAR